MDSDFTGTELETYEAVLAMGFESNQAKSAVKVSNQNLIEVLLLI